MSQETCKERHKNKSDIEKGGVCGKCIFVSFVCWAPPYLQDGDWSPLMLIWLKRLLNESESNQRDCAIEILWLMEWPLVLLMTRWLYRAIGGCTLHMGRPKYELLVSTMWLLGRVHWWDRQWVWDIPIYYILIHKEKRLGITETRIQNLLQVSIKTW